MEENYESYYFPKDNGFPKFENFDPQFLYCFFFLGGKVEKIGCYKDHYQLIYKDIHENHSKWDHNDLKERGLNYPLFVYDTIQICILSIKLNYKAKLPKFIWFIIIKHSLFQYN